MKKTLSILGLSALGIAGVASLGSCSKEDSTESLDISINYTNGDEHYGVTYQGATSTDALDGTTLTKNTILPTWKAFGEAVNLKIRDAADYTKTYDKEWEEYTTSGFVKGKNQIDLMMCDGKKSADAANAGKLYSISQALKDGKLPNYKKWLEKNDPSGSMMKSMASTDGQVYYTPYFDGLNNIECMFMMNREMVEKLLDNDGDYDTTAAKTSNFKAQVAAMNNAKVTISKNGKKETIEVTIPAEKNIITQQNNLDTRNGQTYTQTLKAYLNEIYATQLTNGTFSKLSDIFCSESACYNADELIALLRCVQYNPKYLTGTDEIYAFAPRAAAGNRQRQIAALMQIWGVRGMNSENGKFYYDNNGKLVDGRTQQATYDAFDNLHELYNEGLFPEKYYKGYNNDTASDTYRKQLLKAGKLFMAYDYSASTMVFNADATSGSKTTSFEAILPPVVQWNDGDNTTDYFHYTEDNRALKSGGWAIPASSDNIDGALKLMDYMFTDEGADLQDYGPNTTVYRKAVVEYDATTKARKAGNGTIDIGGQNVVAISNSILNNASFKSGWNNFYRKMIGSTQGIGHQRSDGLDYQANLSQHGKDSLVKLNACVQNGSFVLATTSAAAGFKASVPTNITIASADSTAIKACTENTNLEGFWKENKNDTTGYSFLIVEGWSGTNTKAKTGVETKQAFLDTFAKIDSIYLAAYNKALGK